MSVVIPCFNDGDLVVQAVRSVLAQSWLDLEVIVVDDGSTDNTQQLLLPFEQHIRYAHQPNKGRSAARNLGISMATGKYIAFLDADDMWYPEKLERQISSLRQYPQSGWVYCMCRLVDELGHPLASDFWPTEFGSGTPGVHRAFDAVLAGGLGISTSTIVVDRELLGQVGVFDETLATGEDTDLWLRLAHADPLVFVPEVMTTRRVDTGITFRERYIAYESHRYNLQVIRNTLERFELDPCKSQLARQALCGNLLNSALIELGGGNRMQAVQHWREGLVLLDESQLVRGISTRLAQFALSSARYHPRGPNHAQEILAELIVKIPAQQPMRRKLSRCSWSEFNAAVAHTYSAKGNRPLAARYARKALRSGPTYWRNVGVLKQALPIWFRGKCQNAGHRCD